MSEEIHKNVNESNISDKLEQPNTNTEIKPEIKERKNNFVKNNNNNYHNKDKKDYKNLNKDNDYKVEVLAVNRVSCTTAGGRRMSFRAIVVVGDSRSYIGIGSGKSADVPGAINKAERQAKKKFFKVPMYGKTIMHDIEGSWGATKIILKRAKNGTGFITSNLIKSILSLSGMENLVGKIYGSTNKNNVILALLNAISKIETPKRIAARRGKLVHEIINYKEERLDHKEERLKKGDETNA